ncbi:immunity protein Tsi6 family protein [Chryseobacterium sp. EO14]|uniref:immunity protein Tsi6 family protein n=1 Tax=Chryseobacterium sp. EO14 TaxID=2950551 RepID=UPI00210EC7B8|nr:immunity protein Tsi6 family protein [Chryseobacterium sp. EO14]MCQ4141562.1 immunity protein Tsi6 family protein [Chryseobacterium sp. EO14]
MKKSYRDNLNLAIHKTEELIKLSPEIPMYQSIYRQLLDINEKIIKNTTVFSENELYKRYFLGHLAVKNFDYENDEYAKLLIDIFGGVFDYHASSESFRQLLFDGDEEKCLHEVFEVNHQKIRLIYFCDNPLKELKKEIDRESFDLMVEENSFKRINNIIEKYISEKGLEIYYLKKNDLIYLFSYGEYQPGRYMLFLEDIRIWNS